MKKTLRFSALMLLALGILLINGCSKAEDGKDGEPGAQGPQGVSGNSNVISHTYSVSSWNSTSYSWYRQVSVPEITPDNINTAMVQAYFSVSPNNWVAMPYTAVSSTNYYMSFISAIGIVEVDWVYNGIGIGDNPNTYYSATTQIKVVVIPPAMVQANPGLDFKNYNAVRTAFNLRD